LTVVVVVVAFLAMIFLSALAASRRYAAARNCINNLKQIGIAERIWADEHNDLYPAEFYTNTSGGPLFLGTNLFGYFQAMSNELKSPQVLVCPADWERTPATDWVAGFKNSHISYFVGLDANETHPGMFLAGDWNITNGTSLTNGVLVLTTNHPAHWTSKLHNGIGNVGLTDGSVQQLGISELDSEAAQAAGEAGTNVIRLGIP
jgi:hypothetical protein